jgi:hypothetical protein
MHSIDLESDTDNRSATRLFSQKFQNSKKKMNETMSKQRESPSSQKMSSQIQNPYKKAINSLQVGESRAKKQTKEQKKPSKADSLKMPFQAKTSSQVNSKHFSSVN